MATAGAGVDCCTLALTGMPCLPSYDCSCSVAAVTGSNSVAEEAKAQLSSVAHRPPLRPWLAPSLASGSGSGFTRRATP